jgi:hypothetical protein
MTQQEYDKAITPWYGFIQKLKDKGLNKQAVAVRIALTSLQQAYNDGDVHLKIQNQPTLRDNLSA